jgi:phosphoribosylamine---glycine ligase
MVSHDQFNVLEFNVRFGDPETQAILPRLKSDLLPLTDCCC